MKCLFLGHLANHATIGRVAAFKAAGYEMLLINVGAANGLMGEYPIDEVAIIDDWHKRRLDPYYRVVKKRFMGHMKCHRIIKSSIEYFRIIGMLSENINLEMELRQVISTCRPDFAVLHFGTGAIHYARIIKRVQPNLPVIDILNLLPSNLALGGKKNISLLVEMASYHHWLGKIDGVIFASKEMHDFAERQFGKLGKNITILPDYLPKDFQYADNSEREQLDVDDDNPSVIFLGAPERFGNKLDDVDEEFMKLACEKVHVYSSAISDRVVATGFGHRYHNLSNHDVFRGLLSKYANSFDAALVTYNKEMINKEERFRSTLPTRFFSALSAGIPVAVREGFVSCSRFVADQKIGFTYKDEKDLKSKLLDKAAMFQLRNKANEMRKQFHAEAQSILIGRFVEKLFNR